jgi:CHAT domain-containing protein
MRIAILLLATLALSAAGPDLDTVEKTAGDAYAAKDYPASLKAYQTSVSLARESGAAAKLPFYFRRIGLCNTYLGDMQGAIAAYREGVAASEQAADNAMLIENLHGLALNLQRTGQYREALPLCQRELALSEQFGSPDSVIHALTTYAEVMGWLGHVKEALAAYERAYEISPRSSAPTDHDATLSNLAMGYGAMGDYDTSLRLLQSLPAPNANILNAIAVDEMHLNRAAEAEASYRAAIAAATAPVQWRLRASTLINLGVLLHARWDLTEARASVEEGLALARAHGDLDITASALAELSVIAADAKNAPEATGRAAEALAMARDSEDPARITDALVAQAHALDISGRADEAGRIYAQALEIAEGLRADTPASPAGLQGELEQWLPTYQYAVDHEIAAGNPSEALRLADRAKARVLLDMLDGGQPGFEALADPQERAAEQQVRDEVSSARRLAVTKPSAASKAALETALRKEDDFDVSLYARHPELLLQRAAPPDIRPADLAALIPNSRTALLAYFVMRETVALFVVRGGQPGAPSVKAFTLAGGDKLRALIRSFRAQIAARDLDYRVAARQLFDALLAPAQTALRGADRWILSPDGALWDVPFQALMDPQGKHLLETHALSYAPSLSVLRELREKPAAPGAPHVAVLAVANPSVAGVAPIPEAAREASAIAALYGQGHSALLAGEHASAALFRENAAGAGVIHIAAHAETETNHPLESFLLLASAKTPGDGALTARDLLGMRLRANLVVLSACETARGKIGDGDGVMGLGWAMLAAGARASVLSQWKVDSAATSDLMIDFHRRLTAPGARDKAEALRQASLDAMRSPGRLHPFYWAAFIVVGDAR